MKLEFSSIKPLRFDWDEGNKQKNYKKHQVTYKECEEVFFNQPNKNFIDKRHSQQEKRFIILGVTDQHRKLFISYTVRNQQIRIISARDQSKKERKLYAKK